MRRTFFPGKLTLATLIAVTGFAGCSDDSTAKGGNSIETEDPAAAPAGINDTDYDLAVLHGFDETKDGVRLALRCNAVDGTVQGKFENTWDGPVEKITISVELSNGERPAPLTFANVEPGGTRDVSISVENRHYNRWKVKFDVNGATGTAPVEDAATGDDANSDDGANDDGANASGGSAGDDDSTGGDGADGGSTGGDGATGGAGDGQR